MANLKTKEDLLKDLTKANHARKAVLANRAGFNSVDEYRKHLQNSDSLLEALSTSKPKIHIVNILDVSSSMQGSKFEKAFSGIVNEINEFKTDVSTDYTASFISFSYGVDIKRHYFNIPISEVKTPILNASGMTALNKAVGETLEGLLKLDNREVKTIVSIFTDGEENNSRGKYSSNEAVAKIIKEAEEAGITVTFIGTERDTRDVINNFKIQKSNTLVHDNTAKSIENSFKTKLTATRSYSANVSRGASNEELLTGFYSKSTGKL